MRRIPRRRCLQGVSALAAGTVAGCTDGGGGGGGAVGTVDAPDDVAEYLSNAPNFDGVMEDETDADRTRVDVGAESDGGAFAFEPPALQITTDTTVVWEWAGDGEHNVVEQSDYFSSGEPVSGADKTFELPFQETGTYRYYCRPHRSLGMKGAIVVVDRA